MAPSQIDVGALLDEALETTGPQNRVNDVLAALSPDDHAKIMAAFADGARFSTAALTKVINKLADHYQINRVGETTVRRFRKALNA